MPTQNPNYIAGGTLYPKRFVTLQTDADLTVEESNAGDMPVGITGIGTRVAPIPELGATAEHVQAGETPRVHGLGEEAWLVAGDTVTAGAYVKPDNDGKGVAATTGDEYGARALSAASTGEDIRVFVERGTCP